MVQLEFLGIRHHGPNCAKSLLRVLKEQKPDCILIELPEDVEHTLEYIGSSELKPPIAICVHDTKDAAKAAYLPFAHFSPEYQALLFARQTQTPVMAIDLPMSIQFANTFSSITHQTRPDPLGTIAELAGYSDREQWWSEKIEEGRSGEEIFPAINLLMREMRKDVGETSEENQMREAFMRQQIRAALKRGYQRLAIITGAGILRL